MGGALAPEAGAGVTGLAYMVLGLVALLGVVVVRGLLYAWPHTLGYVLNWLGKNLDFSFHAIGVRVPLDIGGPFLQVDRLVISAMQSWESGLEAEVAYFFHGGATLLQWTVDQLSGLADDVADTFDWAIHVHVPSLVSGLVKVGELPGILEKWLAKTAGTAWHVVTHVTHQITHEITHTVVKTVAAAGAIAIPSPWAFPRFHDWYNDITGWRAHVNFRLNRLWALLGVAGMAAAMANVLGLPNWRCLTKGNVGKTARRLCGLSPRALEDLFALIADLLIVADICQVTTLLVKGFGLIETPLTDFVTAASSWACYGNTEKPATVPVPQLYLPRNPGVTTFVP